MSTEYLFREIEKKWQKYWEDEKTFQAADTSDKPKYYVLEMFPYPSGAGLSVGHVKNYAPTDAFCRYKSMQGFNVLHPMGWDAFGQPAENEAIKRGRNPREMVPEYSAAYRNTLKMVGASYDWSREINSSDPAYYKWTQWMFLLLYKRGLAYRATAMINWCPSCKTGLANEEVKEGRCWRCDTPVEKRPLPQWYFKITDYADRLLTGLDTINWPEGVKQMQREWIGRSEGAEVTFQVQRHSASIPVFTTRPDTLWGATFMVLAPEHALVDEITTEAQKNAVSEYVKRVQNTAEIDRMNAERVKTGVFTGAYAVNPVNREAIPIWIADYVLMGYGTGAIMAVPAHDQRDFEFARKYDLNIRLVYRISDNQDTSTMPEAVALGGVMEPFGAADVFPFAGIANDKSAIGPVIRYLEDRGIGKGQIQFKLRDWLISRQRYWGAPIPIIHCAKCGEVAVPDDQLPVELPDVENYQPSGTGESPLATIPEFVNTTCPICGSPAKRETDTMGGFACSSWYFLRYADPHNNTAFASREALDYWQPVDLYTGGVEHAVMHLLYARFWTKVLHDAGIVQFDEPFKMLRNQGSMLAWTPGRRPKHSEDSDGNEDGDSVIDWIVLKPEERADYSEDEIVWRWARMSKSKGNVVTPDEMCEKYGADSLRVYEMFVAPFEDNVQWNEDGINGAYRFVSRVWRWCVAALPNYSDERMEFSNLSDASMRLRRRLHQTIQKVGLDLENFRFNTAIAAMMELVNESYAVYPMEKLLNPNSEDQLVISEVLRSITLMMCPFTPHLSDELWGRMGKIGSSYHANWPEFDSAVAEENEVTIVIQINGKVKDKFTVPATATAEQIKTQALQADSVLASLNGAEPVKVIVIPGKLVNIVVK